MTPSTRLRAALMTIAQIEYVVRIYGWHPHFRDDRWYSIRAAAEADQLWLEYVAGVSCAVETA